MDWTPIITGLITAGGSVVGVWLTTRKQRQDDEIRQAIRDQKLDDRLDALEAKVDEHNNYGKKFGEASTSIALLQKDISYIKETIQQAKNK